MLKYVVHYLHIVSDGVIFTGRKQLYDKERYLMLFALPTNICTFGNILFMLSGVSRLYFFWCMLMCVVNWSSLFIMYSFFTTGCFQSSKADKGWKRRTYSSSCWTEGCHIFLSHVAFYLLIDSVFNFDNLQKLLPEPKRWDCSCCWTTSWCWVWSKSSSNNDT